MLIVAVAVSIVIGGAGISAFAAYDYGNVDVFEFTAAEVDLPESVTLGETFTIPLAGTVANTNVKVELETPDGNKLTVIDGTPGAGEIDNDVKATTVGNYVITYSATIKGDSGATDNATDVTRTYTHIVNCKSKGTYEFRVADGGARIPTYIKEGDAFTLPSAALYRKGEEADDEFEPLAAADYTYDIYIDNVKVADKAAAQTLSVGAHSVQYAAKLKDTDKYFNEKFEVKCQKNFTDKTKPKISITGVPTMASLNTKVTLPKTVGTDDYDENVLAKISVTFNGAPVRKVELNEYGYAEKYTDDGATVEFDNAYNLSFYPHELGDYIATFQTFDDDPAGARKSVLVSQRITVTDSSAPKLEKIADSQIPAKWGASVNKVDPADTEKTEAADTKIRFPLPEYSDNDASSNIQVSFEIRDTVNNNTVIKFDNILERDDAGAPKGGAVYKYNSSLPSKGMYNNAAAEEKFTNDGFEFDFKHYTDKLDSSLSKYGKYTVIYQARDAKPNITTKSYEIAYDQDFTDDAAPKADVNPDKYVYIDGKEREYTLPLAEISDSADANLLIEYKLSVTDGFTGDGLTPGDDITAKNGEKIKIKEGDGKLVIIYDDKTYTSVNAASDLSVLTLKISATDDVGNVGKPAGGTVDINLARASLVQNTAELGGVELSVTSLAAKTYGAAVFNGDNNYATGKQINIGSLVISEFAEVPEYAADGKLTLKGMRDYTGFEMYLTDPEGDILDGLEFETFVKNDDAKSKIYVKDITFTPSVVTTETKFYTLTVRAYDITGRSVVKAFNIVTKAGTTGGGDTEHGSVKMPTKGSVMVSYPLNNKTAKFTGYVGDTDTADNRDFIVRKISNAGRFSLMGTQFTAYTTGTRTFRDGYYFKKAADTPEYKQISELYKLDVTESANPVFEILGTMPARYTKVHDGVENPKVANKQKSQSVDQYLTAVLGAYTDANFEEKLAEKFVVLPKVIASTEYANAEIKVTVKAPGGPLADETQVIKLADGRYIFSPSEHGEYTVAYNAAAGSATADISDVVIKVGDVVPPSFALASSHAATAKLNDKFEFKKLSLDAEDAGDLDNVTFVKKLIYTPTGETVYSTDALKGSSGRDKVFNSSDAAYTFDKSGLYTVEYTATDKVGNSSVVRETIDVTAADNSSAVALRVLRTVLIIVGVVLIAGVVLYFWRYRKVKVDK
jgi:hypothetical protein